jgi:acylphosphatase
MAEVNHATVYFGGRVQGVGFRFQVLQLAKEFEVAGTVGNLGDGRVQLEVEGTAADIEAFVTAIEERMHGYIRKTERTHARRSPQFQGFSIR